MGEEERRRENKPFISHIRYGEGKKRETNLKTPVLYGVSKKLLETQTNKVIFEILIENCALTYWHDALDYLLLIPQK